MSFDWWTFALQTVNFAILVWLLHHFLYKPVLRLIDARRSEIDKQFADAKAAAEKVELRMAEVAAQRAKLVDEREESIRVAAGEAAEFARTRRDQAEKEAAALLDDARKTLAREREQALVEVRRSAIDLAGDLARRLIAAMPQEKRAEAWLDTVEEHLRGLPKVERDRLAAQLSSAKLTVVTAAAVSDQAAQQWQDRLRAILGAPIAISFAVNPRLIAGVELHFPEAILRFSLQGALLALRAEAEGHDNPCR